MTPHIDIFINTGADGEKVQFTTQEVSGAVTVIGSYDYNPVEVFVPTPSDQSVLFQSYQQAKKVTEEVTVKIRPTPDQGVVLFKEDRQAMPEVVPNGKALEINPEKTVRFRL